MKHWAPALLLASCDGGTQLFLQGVWPEGETPVLIVTEENGRILSPTPLVIEAPIDRLLIESRERIAIYVQTFAALEDRNLEGCRFSLKEGEPLGAARTSWSSGLVSFDDSIHLEQEEEPSSFPLHLEACSYVASCEAVGQQIVAPVTAYGLTGAAAISDQVMFGVGGWWGNEDPRTFLMRIEGESSTELAPVHELIGAGISLENDGAGLVGATNGEAFRFDFAGGFVGTATLGFVALHMDTGSDGTTLIVGAGGEIVALDRGSLNPRAIAPPVYQSIEPVEPMIATVDTDRFVLFGVDSNLYEWDGRWRELISGEELTAIGADRETILAVPETGAPILYDRDTEEWTAKREPYAGVRVKRVTPFGDGRYLMVGQTGLIEYFNGDRLCLIPNVDTRTLVDVDIAPSGRVAYIVGDTTDGMPSGPIMMRLELP